jgi:hypothetical protein
MTTCPQASGKLAWPLFLHGYVKSRQSERP